VEFECLNCSERISREELIDGRCPICGWRHDEHTSKVHEIDPDLLMLFCQFVRRIEDSLANQASIDSSRRKEGRMLFKNPADRKPLHSFNLVTTRFDLIKIKKCHYCGRHHLRVGNKLLQVQESGSKSTYRKVYTCQKCEQSRLVGHTYYVNQMTNS
jgi:predicted  nucleic acid-binding Zn-ribbon protein